MRDECSNNLKSLLLNASGMSSEKEQKLAPIGGCGGAAPLGGTRVSLVPVHDITYILYEDISTSTLQLTHSASC